MRLSELDKSKVVFEDQPMKLSQLKPDQYQVEDEQPKEMGSAERWGRGLIQALPAAGAVTGGVVGTALGPAGTVGGGILGAAGGKALENYVEGLLGDKKTRQEIYMDPVKEGAIESVGQGAGGLIGKALPGVARAGKSMYKSAFKKIDERLAETGAKPFSDVMLEHGAPTGTTKNVQAVADDVKGELLEARKGLYDEGEQLGAGVDVETASREALSEAQRLKGVRGAEGLGADLEKNVRSLYEPVGDINSQNKVNWLTMQLEKIKFPKLSLSEASELKTRLRDRLPDSAFDKVGKVKGDVKKITKSQAAGLRKQIIEEANKVRKGLGDEIDKINEDLGSLIQAEKPVQMQVRRSNTPNMVTPVDAALNMASPGMGVAKKLADISKTSYFRTKGGKGLIDSAKLLEEDKIRQGLIDQAIRVPIFRENNNE